MFRVRVLGMDDTRQGCVSGELVEVMTVVPVPVVEVSGEPSASGTPSRQAIADLRTRNVPFCIRFGDKLRVEFAPRGRVWFTTQSVYALRSVLTASEAVSRAAITAYVNVNAREVVPPPPSAR